jgi:nucleotide-binding universal stress UspA family protein
MHTQIVVGTDGSPGAGIAVDTAIACLLLGSFPDKVSHQCPSTLLIVDASGIADGA